GEQLPGEPLERGERAGDRIDGRDVAVADGRERDRAEVEEAGDQLLAIHTGTRQRERRGIRQRDELVSERPYEREEEVDGDRALDAVQVDPPRAERGRGSPPRAPRRTAAPVRCWRARARPAGGRGS